MGLGCSFIEDHVYEKLFGGIIYQSLEWNQPVSENKNSMERQLTSRINGLKKISVNSTSDDC